LFQKWIVPSARVGYLGLQRDETTAIASQYYSKLPADMNGSFVLLVDPMLATGGSSVAALDRLTKAGGRPEFLSIHTFRNFAEALSLALERFELGSLPMDEADVATTHVRITKIRKRNLRRCLALIEGLLEQHFMKDTADIFVGDQARRIG